jgi:hypothetical protein
LGGLSSIDEPYILLAFLPIVYTSVDSDKPKILSDNKGKAGIYQWKHKESGKINIGSAFDLYKRFRNYYSKSYLTRFSNSYINRALLLHGYSAFSLSILEIIDLTNLSKEEARKLLLSREQYFLDCIFSVDEPNTYNILKVAGSSLGYKHTPESLAKFSGENNRMFGKFHPPESVSKISIARGGGTIYVYDSQGSLVNTFSSTREAGKEFDVHHKTIMRYEINGKLFKDKWKLSLSLITKE